MGNFKSSDLDEGWDQAFKNPNPADAEAMLKRLEAKAMADQQAQFKKALSNKVWRTRDGRYIDIAAMEDNHLLNSYNLVEKTINNYLTAAGYADEEKAETFAVLLENKLDKVDGSLKKALGDQLKGFVFLHEEISRRNLFQKKLEKAADDVFDVFKDIINSKPDDNETQ